MQLWVRKLEENDAVSEEIIQTVVEDLFIQFESLNHL